MKIAVEEWEMYNNGLLVIKWWDTEHDTEEEIEAFIKDLKYKCGLNGSDAEMFIADVEGETLGLITGDESVYQAYEVQAQIDRLGEDLPQAKMLLENGIVSGVDEAIEEIENIYCTGETSMEDVAREYIEDTGQLNELPTSLQYYFDYEALGRDMEINGTYLTDEDQTIWEYTR